MGWLSKKVVPVTQGVPVTQRVTVEAFPHYDAVPRSEWKYDFPVVVKVRPPKASSTPTPVDFVAVLDISASMTKEMLQHLEKAMLAVVDDHVIGQEDRFCMVSSLSSEVQRCTQLTQMSRHGLEAAFRDVNSLVGAGKSDIPKALQQAVQIIKADEESIINRNPFIVLFSAGGHDSIKEPITDCEFPVYPIGLRNHDAQAMRQIGDASGIPYSYVDRDMEEMGCVLRELIQNEKSFIGANIKIPVSIHDGVRMMKVCSGSREQSVTGNQVHVAEIKRMYAGVDINFTVYLHVLKGEKLKFYEKQISGTTKMKLMTVGGTNEGIIHHVDKPVDVFIKRTTSAASPTTFCPVASAELKRLQLVRRISDLAKNKPTAAELGALFSEFLESGGRDLASKWKLEEDIREMQKGISDANSYRMQGLPYMLSWLSSHIWQRATAKGSPFIPDHFLPTSTLQQHTSPFIPNSSSFLPSTMEQHTMCRAALLHLLPSAISAALVILLLAVLFGFHAGILKALRPALQLVMVGYSTLVTAMNLQQYIYSAVTYSVILGACATFVTKEVVSVEHRAQKLEKEEDEDMKIFKQTERVNFAAYPNACGGRARMSTVQISEMEVTLAVAT